MLTQYFKWLDRLVANIEVQKNITLMLCQSVLLSINLILMLFLDIDYSLYICSIFAIIYYLRGMYLIRKLRSKWES